MGAKTAPSVNVTRERSLQRIRPLDADDDLLREPANSRREVVEFLLAKPAVFLALGELSENAGAFAKQAPIRVLQGADLAVLLRAS